MKGEEGPRHYLTLFLLNLFITAFFTSLQDDVYQLPDYVRELTVLGNLYYFFSMAQFLTLWLYQKEFPELHGSLKLKGSTISHRMVFRHV